METRVLLLVALAVIAAGCAETPPTTSNGGSGTQGLVVEEFSVADSSLTPGQSTSVSITLRNYNRDSVSIQDVSLYNLGFLSLNEPEKGWKDRCTPDRIKQAGDDFYPSMECSWVVQAPDDLKDFSSKSVNVKLNLEYRSNISNNRDPFQINFMPLGEIEQREEIRKTFSNGEVVMELTTENPAPVSGALLQFSIRDANKGDSRKVASNYRLFYTPEKVFRPGEENGCPRQVEPPIGTDAEFSCQLQSSSQGTRNLFISTSYKYVKSPNLDIEVKRP